MYSPLEQFEIRNLFIFSLFTEKFSFIFFITNISFFMIIVFISFFIFLNYGIKEEKIVPFGVQYIIERLYIFVFDLVKNTLGSKAYKYFPIFFLTFGIILFSNLIGLMPYSYTVTSQIVITGYLAFSYFLGFIFIGLLRLGFKFFYLFVPAGVSKNLLPLIIIEIVSFLFRPLSLSVRLFANMFAGHVSLHIIASFFFMLYNFNFFVALLPLMFLFLIFILEFGIAFIQAYVFLFLLIIYLRDSLCVNF